MSSVFNHAIRWEFTDRNPITGPGKGSGVRVSAKRERTPDILEVPEMHLLFGVLGIRERAMVFLDSKRASNPPSQAAEPVLKCGYGSSDERSHGKTTDTGRDSADCGGVCNERHATE